ncbi:S8 family serine peptidase [Streptomyces inhibens]|uniref:S8 family serine peptidase n=1 Tax=Streptomyces inhibens TaxID=2293571 RepID=UPI00379A89D1
MLLATKSTRKNAGAVSLAAALTAALTVGMTSGAHGLPGTAGAEGHHAGGASFASQAGKPEKTVTLVTGDKVFVDGKGGVARVQRAKGREGMPVSVMRAKGHTYSIPQDAAVLLTQGRLDRRLFDVTQLIAWKYDDAHRDNVPLIVSYTGGKQQESVARSGLSTADVDVRHRLSVVNADAVAAPKSGSRQVWDALTDASRQTGFRATAPGIAKVWLDGKRKATLDKSVPQIGAPTAWKAGFDGKGVRVAVLDSGVDQTHPDLADREIAEKNFSAAKDSVDRIGHGTHVASTIAGTGKQSGGKYRGVAPGAQILDGKVLDDDGSGNESGIIAGMQWAVDQGAKVVNLSLGDTDTPQVDPVEQAVNKLSKDKGTLFVIAAGNEGPTAGSVATPGSAQAALTVGAVDKKDKIAEFSSVGPTSDGSLKPDITAPGVGIVAARTTKGTSADPGYLAMDGTSMATPHVAGAAALMAQQHPDWTGRRIKQTLTASAEPGAGLSAYQQGSGRTDLTKAIKQTVVSEQTSLSFGVQKWPHGDDKPVTKKVTYRNSGKQTVALTVSVEATGPGGKQAPAGMFKTSADKVTVPVGGTADIDVTADTRIGSVDGAYSGALVAKAGEQTVRTTLGVVREVPHYTLTLKHLDNNGKPAKFWSVIYEPDDNFLMPEDPDGDGVVKLRLPKGNYNVKTMVYTPRTAGEPDNSFLVQPKLSLTKDTTVTLDGHTAKPIKITPPEPKARITNAFLMYAVPVGEAPAGDTLELDDFSNLRAANVGDAAASSSKFIAAVGGSWSVPGKGNAGKRYHLAYTREKTFFTGFTHETAKSELARVNVTMGAPASGKKGQVLAHWDPPMGRGLVMGTGFQALPGTWQEYVTMSRGYKWGFTASQHDSRGGKEVQYEGEPKIYHPGRTYNETFDIGVFGPAGASVTRVGDEMQACFTALADGAGRANVFPLTATKENTVLTADGKKLLEVKTEDSGPCKPVTTVPAKSARYQLSTDWQRSAKVSGVSTRITAAWTFTSEHVSDDKADDMPLPTVRFTPKLDLTNAAKAGQRFTVPLAVGGLPAHDGLKELAVQVSYDGGKTWQKATVTTKEGKRYLTLSHPKSATSVSFKAALTDAKGNTLSQTIISAYKLAK